MKGTRAERDRHRSRGTLPSVHRESLEKALHPDRLEAAREVRLKTEGESCDSSGFVRRTAPSSYPLVSRGIK